jgi:DNA mismatch repair protein MutS
VGIKDLTPAMRQYLEVKEKHQDCIIFFRMGDFYEMFFEDAVTASKVLEITLTSRNKGKENSIPLCGVPYHAASSYIAKLIDKGFKVAVCEQVEDPKEAKGIVKRAVVRVVTPGLVVDSLNLEEKENNFLAGFAATEGTIGLAFIDISTGEFWVTEADDEKLLLSEISGLNFREVIAEDRLKKSAFFKSFVRMKDSYVNYLSSDYFVVDDAASFFTEYFDQGQLDKIDFEHKKTMSAAACAVLRYVKETQKEGFGHINTIKWYPLSTYLILDDTARRNLEIFSTIQENRKVGSLFHVLDQTVTSMGGRRLRWWLNYPLVDTEKIKERLLAVSEIKEGHHEREALRTLLSDVYDIERLGSKISIGIANARDLVSLKNSLLMVPAIQEEISHMESAVISEIYSSLDNMPDVVDLIDRAIKEDPPMTVREGNIIREDLTVNWTN